MEKEGSLDSVSEAEQSEDSKNWSSESENGGSVVEKQGVSEYEKQRLSRIAENKARMEALGLHTMASSLMGSPQKSGLSQKSTRRKGKRRVVVDDDDEEDEDYRPHDDDKDDDDKENDDDDGDYVGRQSSSKSSRNKIKKKSSELKKKVPIRNLSKANYIDQENDGLMQAIALSLQDSAKGTSPKETEGSAHGKEDAGRRKQKKRFSSRVKMTEDELVLHFFQFDEAGRGVITMKDLKRMATAHDFTWTDKELTDMIRLFDNDGDGKLTLQDFHQIVGRCNMIQGSEN